MFRPAPGTSGRDIPGRDIPGIVTLPRTDRGPVIVINGGGYASGGYGSYGSYDFPTPFRHRHLLPAAFSAFRDEGNGIYFSRDGATLSCRRDRSSQPIIETREDHHRSPQVNASACSWEHGVCVVGRKRAEFPQSSPAPTAGPKRQTVVRFTSLSSERPGHRHLVGRKVSHPPVDNRPGPDRRRERRPRTFERVDQGRRNRRSSCRRSVSGEVESAARSSRRYRLR